jgi:hypothetical protein
VGLDKSSDKIHVNTTTSIITHFYSIKTSKNPRTFTTAAVEPMTHKQTNNKARITNVAATRQRSLHAWKEGTNFIKKIKKVSAELAASDIFSTVNSQVRLLLLCNVEIPDE